jgi:hypothetical protein
MSNGTSFSFSRVFPALLIASLFVTAGCDSAPRPLPRHASGASLLDPSDGGRERSDPARSRVWILNSQGVFLYNASTGNLVEVTLPSWQWVDVPYSCPPDLALGPEGEAVVSSNIVPVLWRIDPDTLAVSMHALALDADAQKDVGFTELVYSAQHGAYLASSATHGSLWQIDPFLREGRKVAQLTPVHDTCSAALPRGAG